MCPSTSSRRIRKCLTSASTGHTRAGDCVFIDHPVGRLSTCTDFPRYSVLDSVELPREVAAVKFLCSWAGAMLADAAVHPPPAFQQNSEDRPRVPGNPRPFKLGVSALAWRMNVAPGSSARYIHGLGRSSTWALSWRLVGRSKPVGNGALGAPQLLAPWLQGPKVLSLCAARRHLTRHALPVVNHLAAPAPD